MANNLEFDFTRLGVIVRHLKTKRNDRVAALAIDYIRSVRRDVHGMDTKKKDKRGYKQDISGQKERERARIGGGMKMEQAKREDREKLRQSD